ncbi:MAG TPA: CHAT domain-containing protein [Pyrinomonadaceae bacterium]
MKSIQNAFALRRIFSTAQVLMFLWLSVAPALGHQTQADPETQTEIRDLPIGTPIERKLEKPEMHAYGIELKQGEVVRVSIKEKGVDVNTVFIRAADESKASAGSNSGSGFMRESLTLIAEQDGVYVLGLRVEPVTTPEVPATYELSATRSSQASGADLQRVKAEMLVDEASRAIPSSNDRQSLVLASQKVAQAIPIWRGLGEEYWAGMTEVIVASGQVKAGDFGSAEGALKNSLRIFESLQDEAAIANVSVILATVYLTMKDPERATPLLNRCLTISRKLGDKRIESLTNLIGSASLVGDLEKPIDKNYSEQISRTRAQRDQNAEAMVWANHVLRNGLDDEALEEEERIALFARAEKEALPLVRALKARDLELHILVGLGLGFYEDEPEDPSVNEKSLQYTCQAIVLAQIQNNRGMQAYAYLQLYMVYTGEKDPLAIFFGKKALDVMQGMRDDLRLGDKESQQAAAKQLEDGFGDLITDFLSEGRHAEALQVINQSRDQEFYDFKIVFDRAAKLTLSPREAESSRIMDETVNRAAAKYANVIGPEFAAAGSELRNLLPRLEQRFSGPNEAATGVPDAVDLQSAMRELSALTRQKHVAIYVDTEIQNLILVTPEGVKGFTRRFTSPAEWNDNPVPDFLRNLRSPKVDPRPDGARLYRKIFKQVELVNGNYTNNTLEAELARYRPDVLHWSIGGNLRYVPMAALYDPEAKQYLVEKFQNVIFTRSRKERFLLPQRAWTQGVGFGTSIAYQGFSALPGVVEELALIFGDEAKVQKGLLSGRVFLNTSFTRQTLLSVRSLKPDVVHIASHFKFEPGDSRNSFVLLGDGSRVSLYDMQQVAVMFAGVDLITLSACETAAQQSDSTGREIDGFAELAQRLGANSVIATLWKISDGPTARLMTDFYRLRMENPGAPKSEILRRAQLNLLRGGLATQSTGTRPRTVRGTDEENATGAAKLDHPYYWAAFVLYGSSR